MQSAKIHLCKCAMQREKKGGPRDIEKKRRGMLLAGSGALVEVTGESLHAQLIPYYIFLLLVYQLLLNLAIEHSLEGPLELLVYNQNFRCSLVEGPSKVMREMSYSQHHFRCTLMTTFKLEITRKKTRKGAVSHGVRCFLSGLPLLATSHTIM